MALSTEIKQKIEEKIKPFLKACPLCGNNNFYVHEDICAYPSLILEIKKVNLERLFPAIMIGCENCQNTLIFHAKLAGIID